MEDPSSGEILAMDGANRYDLNDPRNLSSLYSADEIAAMNDSETMDALSAMWNNFCVTDILRTWFRCEAHCYGSCSGTGKNIHQ